MSDFDSLMIDLFGTSKQEQKPEIKIEPVKEKEIFSYRLERLKNKLSDFLSRLKQAGASYTVTNIQPEQPLNNNNRVKIICEDNTLLQSDLMNELRNDLELEVLLILNFLQYSDCLREKVEGLATYRIYRVASDNKYFPCSLFLAVLSVFKKIKEVPSEKHKTIEEIYQEYDNELKNLGIECPAIRKTANNLKNFKCSFQRISENHFVFMCEKA